MNWAWWDGKMSFEHYREEHGLDSETLLEAARAEALGKHDQAVEGNGGNGNGKRPAASDADVVEHHK